MSQHQPPSQTAVGYTITAATDKCHDAPVAKIALGSLHNLVTSSLLNSPDQFPGQCDGLVCGGVGSASCEGVRDEHVGGVMPDTPQRASQANPVTPLTPLANLKVLMAAAAASSAMEGREGGGGQNNGGGGEVLVKGEGRGGGVEDGNAAGRKMKSLALLCKKFLSIVESSVGTRNDFSLDMMAQNLGTNRRRIYDIINVLEAVEMIVKQSKNWYTWNGRGGLLNTLAKLKAMAGDDPELLQWFKTDDCKENMAPPTITVAKQQGQSSVTHDEGSQDGMSETSYDDGQTKGGRWDKSLGVLCQKFIMLFLIAPGHELTLDLAGGILMPDDETGAFTATPSSTNPSKTKVRRLYDIANVLTTLDLIRKKTFLTPNHRKMPGYVWCGPSMEEIDTVSVCRKSDFPSAPAVYPRKMKGTSLVRKSSIGNRPFIHQYEVKDSNSAPNTPCKSIPTTKPLGGRLVGNLMGGRGGGNIRRSLSFGGHSSTRLSGTPNGGCVPGMKGVTGPRSEERQVASSVLVRPLSSKQVDYMNEVREFELEMRKHSHRYPHVVSAFQDFIRWYQSTLEQAAVSGHTILPKLPSPSIPLQQVQLHPLTNFADPLGFSTPQTSSNPNDLDPSLDFSNLLCDATDAQPQASPLSTPPPSADQLPCVTTPHDKGLQSTNSQQNGPIASGDAINIPKPTSEAYPHSDLPYSATLPSRSGLVSSGSLLVSRSLSDCQHTVDSIPLPAAVSLSSDPITSTAAPSPPHTHPEKHVQQLVWSKQVQLANSLQGYKQDSENEFSGLVPSQQLPQATTTDSLVPNSEARTASATHLSSHTLTNSDPRNTCVQPNHTHTNKASSVLPRKAVDLSPALALQGFTRGTIQSPEKPAHGNLQSFVRVEDFLSALAAQPRCGNMPRDPRLGRGAGSSGPQPSSLLNPPTGVQPLATLSLLSQLLSTPQQSNQETLKTSATPISCPLPLNPSSLVNQKPIPATAEVKTKAVPKSSSEMSFRLSENASSSLPYISLPSSLPEGPLLINPNAFLSTPSRFLPPQALLPNSSPGFISLAPNIFLPPFSTLCAPSSLVTSSGDAPTPQTASNASSSEESPPKRAKLN